MKTIMASGLWLALTLLSLGSAKGDNVRVLCPEVVNSNSVTVTLGAIGQTPTWTGFLVLTNSPMDDWHKRVGDAEQRWQKEFKTNHYAKFEIPPQPPAYDYNAHAQWIPFATNLVVDLGRGDGQRTLWLGFRYKGQTNSESWDGYRVMVRTAKPVIYITHPRKTVTSQPMIELKGYCPAPLRRIRYNVLDQNGRVTKANQEGLVNDQYYDPELAEFTTNYFTCYDIDLTPGTNTIVFTATDDAGNSIHTNIIYVFSTAGVVAGPKLTPKWPPDNDRISGSTFTLRGQCDDPTANITALIVYPSGEASRREAEVERNGRYWVENIPLRDGRTYITLVANNAAGYTTITNLSVRKSRYELAMNPVVPASRLWAPRLTITGTTTYDPSNYTIWVNGVKATTDSNGHWKAENVPTTRGGVAIFDMKAVAKNGRDESDKKEPGPARPIIWGNATNGIKWGVYLAPGDTNHMNRQHCDFYVINNSDTNMNFRWVRPKTQALYTLTLDNRNEKAVPKNYLGKETGLPLTTDLNIQHLDSNAIQQIDGILPLTTNTPAHVAAVNLMNLFSRVVPGEYRLECSGHLYQITATGRLMPIALPPVSLPVAIAWQPSEMVFYLRRLQAKGEFTWGKSAGGLQVGVAHGFEPQLVGKGDEIEVYLMNTTTNDFHNLILPAPDQRFAVSLEDASGNMVPKTTLGAQQGRSLALKGNMLDFKPVLLRTKDVSRCARFNLNTFFKIKSPGQYRLTYQQRLCKIGADGTPERVIIPKVAVAVQIR